MPLVFPQPPISTTSAHLAAFGFAFCYVGSLYISKNARLSFSRNATPNPNGEARLKEESERWRDDPAVIRARLTAVTISTLLCCSLLLVLLWQLIGFNSYNFQVALRATFVRLGVIPSLNLYSHLVTPVLFLGPLYGHYLSRKLPFQSQWSVRYTLLPIFISWQGLRNHLIAPVTEEIVFRACVLSVYHLSGASRTKMILLGPLSFGLAHLHHAWDTYNRYGRTSSAAKRAIISSLFQLGYTTVFGFHCSYLFLRTGSLYPPITAHIFCNIMGLPQLSDELSRFSRRKAAIIITYIVGIVAFVTVLAPWTDTPGSFYWQNYAVKNY